MTGFALEVALHWAAVGLYVLASLAFAHAVLFEHPERSRYGVWLGAAGLAPHAAALAYRWITSGHGPYMARYEVLSSTTFVAIAVLLGFCARRPRWRVLAMLGLPLATLAVAAALFANPEVRQLPPSLRSVWLFFHVLFAKLSAGAWLLSAATAALVLVRRAPGRARTLSTLPHEAELDAYTVRFAGFGLVFWTVTVAAGAIWANQSWGRYWGWDPAETWSLIAWLCYGSFLHARLLLRLRGAPAAWAALACFLVFALAVFFVPTRVASLHSSYFQ
ncbi:cytochrome c biogenesis protein [Anaeromyxobacter paludicola]|uniref:Cytochrome c biogenesis protein ResC n=1 Tax=Anaeromyxobacter paludicola TaxID=2918171 RepID=A0ABM7X6E2_9BACT|nr:cytochrome c biogenesis protein CcsA [Anaeromyxobacter paludicola]BDG07399.1 cytochrome c biogenesis protein ResC [Anaeromyxobacter paludicola]